MNFAPEGNQTFLYPMGIHEKHICIHYALKNLASILVSITFYSSALKYNIWRYIYGFSSLFIFSYYHATLTWSFWYQMRTLWLNIKPTNKILFHQNIEGSMKYNCINCQEYSNMNNAWAFSWLVDICASCYCVPINATFNIYVKVERMLV